jgi:hypothetical protein
MATGLLVTRQLQAQRHPDVHRTCLGLLSLSRRHGRERLEAACALALELGERRRHVRDILITARDWAVATPADFVSPNHPHVPGPRYYQQ